MKKEAHYKLAAARAAAKLPKGYVPATGQDVQRRFFQAITAFEENADAAAQLINACADANLADPNRRQGPQSVIEDMNRQMEYITGDHVSARRAAGVTVKSYDMADPDVEMDEELNRVVG